MASTLIFSLGDKLEEKSENTTYMFENKKYKNKYLLDIYFQELEFDKIICFGNSRSSWEYLYRLMYLKYYGCEPCFENLEYLKEIRELYVIEEFFLKDRELKDRIIIKYFEENLEKKEMIDYIYKIKKEMDKTGKIIIDLTGGKRDLPIFIIQLMNLIMYNRDGKKRDIEVLYAKSKGNRTYKIISLKDFIEKINYTHDISPFSKYGCPLKFKKYIKDIELAKYLDMLYIYSQYNLTKELVNHINKFEKMEKMYTVYIQKKIIETKISQWKNLVSKKVDKDTLVNYHLELSNEPLATVAKVAKMDNENLKDRFDNKNYADLKDVRNSVVHAYNKKNLKYSKLEKVLESNFYTKKNKKKINEILVANIGDARNYKMVSYSDYNLNTSFSFRVIMENNKFEKIYLVGFYSNEWNYFIDKWISELGLDIEREYDITTDVSEDVFEEILNKELKRINTKFECIIIHNSFSIDERNKYFEKITEKLIKENKKYLVTYDMTYSYRDVCFINYINLHCLELLGMLKIKEIVYASLKNKTAKLENMNRINSIMNLFKSVQEFELYNKYDEVIDVNKELKELMKKISRIYNFNQVTSLDSIRNDIVNFTTIENQLEKEIVNNIKKIYVNNTSDKYSKIKNMIKNQLKFNNLAQALYLTWDLVLNGLLEDDKLVKYSKYKKFNHIEQDEKKKFLKISNQFRHMELYKFYEKYKHFSIIRNESAHVNLKQNIINLETISIEIENCLKELDILIKNKRKYEESFLKYYEKERKNYET